MIKKTLLATLFVAAMCIFATPAQAQFKKLGKSLGKVAKDAGGSVQDMASDAAMEMGANKVSDKIIEFMDDNNTLVTEDSDYAKRLKSIVGSKFTSVEGKTLDVKVYENAEANVLTLNNGSIRLYSGMLDILDDNEVKALLALQAGQITSGNVRNNLMKVGSGDSAEGAGAAQMEKMLSFSGDKFGSVVNELLQLPYTAEQNAAADKVAKDYLTKEGGSTEAYTSLLTKIQSLGQIDLEADDVDETDANVIKATAASKFVSVNKLR